MKYFNCIVFLLFFYSFSFAQQSPLPVKGLFKGLVLDADKKAPLEFATISVYSSDSTLINGGITAADGSFSIELNKGRYYAIIRFISYHDVIYENIEISGISKIYNAGNILLSSNTRELAEVEVVGEKSEMVINLDKKVFNVGQDLSNTGKSALDILDNIPSISVDLDGNVSLRGSQNLQILVDGKPSGIADAENTEALQNMQGSMIERVEVVTNPSARYEAEGMGGIINIVLKKEQKKGVNGSFELTTGYPQNHSFGANVNFRREKINYFVNYTIRYRENPGSGNSYQHFTRSDTSYFTIIERSRMRTGLSNQARAGFDYFLNPKSTITASFLINYQIQNNLSYVLYHDYLPDFALQTLPGNLLYVTQRADNENENSRNIEGSLIYEKKFSKPDHKLTLMAQYDDSYDDESSRITEEIVVITPSNLSIYENLDLGDDITNPDTINLQRSSNDEGERTSLIQADYVYPFGKKGKFEAGYRSEFRRITNPYIVEDRINEITWIPMSEYTNDFEYKEDIHALYAQAGNNFDKISLQLGLRAELSNVNTKLKQTNERSTHTYLDFFPTLHTTYEFNQVSSVQLSYSRRIQRPHFRMLNPFHNFTDSRNIRTGNPNLKPEYTHSVEAGYMMKLPSVNLYSGIYYRNSSNVFERINLIDTSGITFLIPVNLSKRNSFGIETNVNTSFGKLLNLTADLNFFRAITSGNYNNENHNSDYFSWNSRINMKVKISKGFDFQTIFFYRAPEETTQGERKAFYMLNMALSKDILKNKGTLTFNVQDVLNSRKFLFSLDEPGLKATNEFRWSKRSYTLTFIYRLNQKKKAGREGRNGGSEGIDEMDF